MAKVTLRRVGYYTIPPLDKLDDFVCGETCVVPNFTIGREGYGNVYFPDSFDVYGLNLDEIGNSNKSINLTFCKCHIALFSLSLQLNVNTILLQLICIFKRRIIYIDYYVCHCSTFPS